MINDVEGVRAALQPTMLAGRPVTQASAGCLRVVGIEPRDMLPAWRAARAALPTTGRWPVFLPGDLGRLADLPEPVVADVAALDRAAQTIDPWPAVTTAWPDEPVDADDLHLCVPTFDGVDLLAEVRQHFASPTTWSVDRWVYDRVIADPRLLPQAQAQAEHRVGTGWWYEPRTVELWFLPTPHPHLAAAWLSYHGTLGQPEVLAAALWQWHQRWGAELVANWSTMLQFVVSRRPALGDEAWELAGQHKALANHLEDDQWLVALALTRSDEWALHDRP